MAADGLTSVNQMKSLQFKDKLAALNRDFLKALRTWYEQCPHFDFSDTVQSYLKHVEALDEQYGGAKENQKEQAEMKAPAKDENAAGGRKIAKAKRRLPADPDKLNESVVVSTPARNPPRFSLGNVSAIAPPGDDTLPVAINEPSAGAGGRKRAIRGGGPLGDKEQVVFRGSDDGAKSAVSSIPPVSINLPKPTTGFWNSQKESAGVDEGETFAKWADKKKSDEKGEEKAEEKKEAPKAVFSFGKTSSDSNGAKKDDDKGKGFGGFRGFDFSAAQKDAKEKEAEPAQPVFSFGGAAKKDSDEKKEEEATKPAFTFGSFNKKEDKKEEPEAAAKPALSFPSFGAKTDSTPAFGAKKEGDALKPTLSFPSFGSTPADGSKPALSFPSFGSSAAAPTLTFGAPKTEEEKKDDEEGEYVPPKAEVVEAEEPGSTYSSKCAVFKMVDKQFTKMGVGMLHLKEVDEKKSILVRAATTTGNVWINAVINKMMKVVKADDKGDRLRLTYPISADEMGIFLIRFGTVAAAEKVLNHINDNNQ